MKARPLLNPTVPDDNELADVQITRVHALFCRRQFRPFGDTQPHEHPEHDAAHLLPHSAQKTGRISQTPVIIRHAHWTRPLLWSRVHSWPLHVGREMHEYSMIDRFPITGQTLDELIHRHTRDTGCECHYGRVGNAAPLYIGLTFRTAPCVFVWVAPLQIIFTRQYRVRYTTAQHTPGPGYNYRDTTICVDDTGLGRDRNTDPHVDHRYQIKVGKPVEQEPSVMVVGATKKHVA